MKTNRSFTRWMINVISFFLFCVLGFTGLINWMVLPKGFAARGTFAVTLRHLLVNVHAWAAMAFVAAIAVHVVLHWPYVKYNLKR